MNIYKHIKQLNFLFLLLFGLTFSLAAQKVAKRPNIVWFMTEDVSKHYLALYNDGKHGAKTPNVDKLAKEGLIFTNAFSNGPVCSAARSTLITGSYGPRLGISFHRKLHTVQMPGELEMFPAYLRKAGYFCSNASKTDYNCVLSDDVWDVVNGKIDNWRERPDKNMPFFHVRTNEKSHEGNLHFKKSDVEEVKTKHNPEKVIVHPYHPNTKLMRYTYARFYDIINEADAELGEMIQMLKEDGLYDDTFIFYFGDNGGTLPGTKGYTSETGLNVPLVVHVPKNFKHLAPKTSNSSVESFVSFVDFGPTLLNLAGLEVPEQMDGKPFLGKDIKSKDLKDRNITYGYADRFDELYSFNRTLRKGKYKYVRNFNPIQPDGLFTFYRYRMEAFLEWKELFRARELNEVQSSFFLPQTAEELYDIEDDPFETRNLAQKPEYANQLQELRKQLRETIIDWKDIGMFPECVWLKEAGENPTEFTDNNIERIVGYLDVADLMLVDYANAKPAITKHLNSTDPVIQYWALIVCASFGAEAKDLKEEVYKLTKSTTGYVQSKAAVFLACIQATEPENIFKSALKNAKSGAESLLILNDVTIIRDGDYSYSINITKEDIVEDGNGVDWRLEYFTEQ